jgi:hypothetical protein
MTAKEKIETLTNSWYGFDVVAGIVSIMQSGIGFFSLLTTLASTLFSFFITWFLGRRLLAKSSLTRFILIIVSALGSILGTVGAVRMGWTFLTSWSLIALLHAAFASVCVYMNARSFRVLTDESVKAYFGA